VSRFQVLRHKHHASSLRSLLVVYHFSLSGRNLVFDPYAAYVLKRWQEDVYEAKYRYEEIPEQGFPGTVRQRLLHAVSHRVESLECLSMFGD
jgi:hypothetical protein